MSVKKGMSKKEIFLCGQNFQVFELKTPKPHNINFLQVCMLTLSLREERKRGKKKKQLLFQVETMTSQAER